MNSFKRFKQIHQSAGKHFREALVLLYFWLILHLFVAAHSSLIPSITALLSQVHWAITLMCAVMLSVLYLMNEKTFDGLFNVNLKQKIETDLAFVVFNKIPPKMKSLMISFLMYVFFIGSMASALIATFFSYSNELILWTLYILFQCTLLFLIKRIFTAWMHTYQYFLQSLEEDK